VYGRKLTKSVWTALEATYEKSTDLTGSGSPAIGKAVLVMIVLYNTFFAIGWGPLQVTYVVEILPYQLRARVNPSERLILEVQLLTCVKGLVLYNFFVALALIFNQYANPIAMTNIKWKCMLQTRDHMRTLTLIRLYRIRRVAFR
jgi:hypothetical protein